MKSLLLCFFTAIGLGSAANITDLCGTAQVACGGSSFLPAGSVDPHYTIISGPVTGSTYAAGHPAWLPNDSNSQWITPLGGLGQIPGGYYTYETTFTAASTNFVINGKWAADNAGYDIILNGKSLLNNGFSGSGLFGYGTVPSTFGFNSMTPFVLSSGFVMGTNTIDFVVQNGNFGIDTTNPSGLRVEMSATTTSTPTPEPGTMALSSLFVLLIAGGVYRRQLKAAA